MAYGKRSSAALKKETTSGTAVRPNTFFELLSENITVDPVVVASSPAANTRSKMYRANKGKIQAPSGNIKFTAEPKTLGHFLNAIYGTPSSSATGDAGGTTYYTNVWTEVTNSSTIPTYSLDIYTPDIGTRGTTKRYFGCRFGQFAIEQNNGVFEGSVSVLAQGAFVVEEIGTATATGAVTLVISKTSGLTTSDTIIVGWGSANEETATISAINVDGITLTVSALTNTHAVGDRVVILPQTPSYTLGKQFTFYGGTTTGANANKGGGATFLYGETLGAATTPMLIEDYRFELGQELEARHAARGYTHNDSYPVAILTKGYDATVKFSQYYQDPRFINIARRRLPVATIFQTYAGNIDADAADVEWLKIETPEIYVKGHNPDVGNDDIIDEQIEADCYHNTTSGFVSRCTIKTTVNYSA